MPVLLKHIQANIISLLSNTVANNFTAPVNLIHTVIGQVGVEDYINLTNFQGFTQNFSNVGDAEFCEITPTNYGLGECGVYTDLTISY